MKKHIKLTMAFCVIFFTTSVSIASPVNVDWVGGVPGPRNDSGFNSISWNEFSENVIFATKNSLSTYDKQGEVIEFVSDIPNGSTVLDLMNSKSTNEFNYSGKNFSGMGLFVEEINGINNIPENNVYWKILVNGEETSVGVSDKIINHGDIIRFVLDSVSNDKVVFEKDLGIYLKVLGTNINQFWEGSFIGNDSYPVEKGQAWNEIAWITTDLNSTFIPNEVSMIVYVEKWNTSIQDWEIQSTNIADVETIGVISQSFEIGEDGIVGTEDDVIYDDNTIPTKSLIFSSSGVTFLPLGQGDNEFAAVNNTRDFLLDNKVRLRFVLSVPFEYSNGTKGVVTEEKTIYKQTESLSQTEEPIFSNINVNEDGTYKIEIDLSLLDSSGLYLFEKSTNLIEWHPFNWKTGSGILEQDVEGPKNFFRIKNKY